MKDLDLLPTSHPPFPSFAWHNEVALRRKPSTGVEFRQHMPLQAACLVGKLLARVGVAGRGCDRGRVRSVGGRTRRCLADFAARFGVHADEFWTSC